MSMNSTKDEVKGDFYRRYVKRSLDFILALVLLIISLPFIIIACIFIVLDSEGPPIFTQIRIGKDAEEFKIYKLRTMKLQAFDKDGNKIRDRDRVTRVGKIVRKLSIDELPQLLNILKGDMSFIGPRPLLVRYLPYYTDEEMRRHDVLPGITGLSQINGRSNLQWEERFEYDVEYVDKISLKLDIKIVWITIKKVFEGSDTSTIRRSDIVDFDEHRDFKKLR